MILQQPKHHPIVESFNDTWDRLGEAATPQLDIMFGGAEQVWPMLRFPLYEKIRMQVRSTVITALELSPQNWGLGI